MFRGSGWNVIKVIWGSKWDELLARDVDGVLLDKMGSTVDGEFQRYTVESGAYIREHFFGPDPRLRKMVEHLTDDELRWLPRGGHDYRKLYAAYKAATEQTAAPTVILAKTIKGWTLGPEVEARNATHQIKKMTNAQLRVLRERLHMQDEIPEEALADGEEAPYFCPPEDAPEMVYLRERRTALDGPLPSRQVRIRRPLDLPSDKPFAEFAAGSGKQAGVDHDGLHPPAAGAGPGEGIRPAGRPDHPRRGPHVRHGRAVQGVRHLRRAGPEVRAGRPLAAPVLHREQAGPVARGGHHRGRRPGVVDGRRHRRTPRSACRWCRSSSSTRCSVSSGWATSSGPPPTARTRGFLLGATAGRTTLLGEGLQHQDGHSHVLATTVPACRAYDPAFAYEMATIVQHGIQHMYGPDAEDVFYYLTLYNENYTMPPMADGVAEGVIEGLYRWAEAPTDVDGPSATILFSGPAQGAARFAQTELAEHYGVAAELWSATSYKQLREEAMDDRAMEPPPSRRAGPHAPRHRTARRQRGPIVAVTDYMRLVPDQIARWVPRRFTSLGTDGFGRSDTREALRRFFETDGPHVVVAVLSALAADGQVKPEIVLEAIRRYDIDPDAPPPGRCERTQRARRPRGATSPIAVSSTARSRRNSRPRRGAMRRVRRVRIGIAQSLESP